MSELLQPVNFDDTLLVAVEQANDDPYFRNQLVGGVSLPYGWKLPNGTTARAELKVDQDMHNLVAETAREVYGEIAVYECAVSLKVTTPHDEWPEEVYVHVLETGGEPPMPAEGGSLTCERKIEVSFTVSDYRWHENKDYTLMNNEDYWDGIDMHVESFDSNAQDELPFTLMSDEERLLFDGICGDFRDVGQEVISEQTIKRVRQVQAIIRCVREGVPLQLEPFFETGAFLPIDFEPKG